MRRVIEMRKYINYLGVVGTVIGVHMTLDGQAPMLVCAAIMIVSSAIYQITEGD